MYILHIETATKICSIALSFEEEVIAWMDHGDSMNHTAVLAPMIESLLKENKVSMSQLGAISLSSGPGSYTGLRVGGSTAKAIAYTLEIPLISVPTLESLASAAMRLHPHVQYIMPMIDARRDEVYTSLFTHELVTRWDLQAMHITGDFVENHLPKDVRILVCGDGAHKVIPFLTGGSNVIVDESILPSARHLVPTAVARFRQDQHEDPMHFTPYYIKPPNITKAKNLV